MGLQIGNVKISACNDHRNYSDEEITYGDVIRAEELLSRADQIAAKTRSKRQVSTLNENKVDSDLDKAVKKLLGT